MHNRIKEIRKKSKLSQANFGLKLGVSRDVINNIENGRVEPKPLIVKHICSVFGISEQWLLTGKGCMTPETENALLDELANEYNMTDKQKRIMAAFAAMDDKKREVLAEAFFDFLDMLSVSPEISATLAVRPADDDRRLTRAEKEAIMKRQLDAEEKAAMSSAFIGISGTEKIG